MFDKKREVYRGMEAIAVSGLGECSLRDTMECGQAFRYELTCDTDVYTEYVTVAYGRLIRVGQRERGELLFYNISDVDFENIVRPYFALDTDFELIRRDIIARTDSEWLRDAAEQAKGIIILAQEPWETLFSFIISQNNNIPRIRKIIRILCAEYGKPTVPAGSPCPLPGADFMPSEQRCRACGACCSFPTAYDVAARPDGLLPAHPGFRYKYLVDAAEKIVSGECDLDAIADAKSYEFTLEELKKICGVGDKVASCTALFGFSNLEAFPIDVWMKRAIELYFGGTLDPSSLGKYAGVAQQYIFHKIRNLDKNV